MEAGSRASAANWKRHWSLPLPVAPWAKASAPTSRATCRQILEISGRAIDVPSRYDAFVLGLPLQDGKGEVAAQFLLGIDHPRRAGADVAGLLQDGLAVFAGLAQVHIDRMNVVALVHEPNQEGPTYPNHRNRQVRN